MNAKFSDEGNDDLHRLVKTTLRSSSDIVPNGRKNKDDGEGKKVEKVKQELSKIDTKVHFQKQREQNIDTAMQKSDLQHLDMNKNEKAECSSNALSDNNISTDNESLDSGMFTGSDVPGNETSHSVTKRVTSSVKKSWFKLGKYFKSETHKDFEEDEVIVVCVEEKAKQTEDERVTQKNTCQVLSPRHETNRILREKARRNYIRTQLKRHTFGRVKDFVLDRVEVDAKKQGRVKVRQTKFSLSNPSSAMQSRCATPRDFYSGNFTVHDKESGNDFYSRAFHSQTHSPVKKEVQDFR